MKSLERVSKFLHVRRGTSPSFDAIFDAIEDLHQSLTAKKNEYLNRSSDDHWYDMSVLVDEAMKKLSRLHSDIEYMSDEENSFDLNESLDTNYTSEF